jgi:hypothetical protein
MLSELFPWYLRNNLHIRDVYYGYFIQVKLIHITEINIFLNIK